MPSIPIPSTHDRWFALAIVGLLVLVAGCSGISAPTPDAGDGTQAAPPPSESDAEERALSAERVYIRENKVPEDATSWGLGGLANPRAAAVARTSEGWFVRVRVGFYYNSDTADGELHADGITEAAYYVTGTETTRVSVPGHEMKGSPTGTGSETLEIRVVNAAAADHEISLTVLEGDGETRYERDTLVMARNSLHTPRLAVSPGEYEVIATTDGGTERLTVMVEEGSERPVRVGVFVAHDGSVTLARTTWTL